MARSWGCPESSNTHIYIYIYIGIYTRTYIYIYIYLCSSVSKVHVSSCFSLFTSTCPVCWDIGIPVWDRKMPSHSSAWRGCLDICVNKCNAVIKHRPFWGTCKALKPFKVAGGRGIDVESARSSNDDKKTRSTATLRGIQHPSNAGWCWRVLQSTAGHPSAWAIDCKTGHPFHESLSQNFIYTCTSLAPPQTYVIQVYIYISIYLLNPRRSCC